MHENNTQREKNNQHSNYMPRSCQVLQENGIFPEFPMV